MFPFSPSIRVLGFKTAYSTAEEINISSTIAQPLLEQFSGVRQSLSGPQTLLRLLKDSLL
jgi:hypothetical protein